MEIKQDRILWIPRISEPWHLAEYLKGKIPEGARVADFRQSIPGDGKPVSKSTTAFLAYDDKHLYVLFDCKEDPTKIRTHLAKREDIEDDDKVSVLLDTFHDRQRAYVFSVNPSGVQRDGILLEGQEQDNKFDALWYSDAQITDDGYVVLLTIPFKSVRFYGRTEQTWGVALSRAIIPNNETSYWPYITRRKSTTIPQFGVLQGITEVSPSHNVTLIPYINMAHARIMGADRYISERDFRAGLDAKLVFRDAFTLDTTINPDFSQVESDDPQVTINQRYEVFFPEKRPFFLENAALFETPINLFFSRRIVDPEFGSRLTGKVGRWSIGALAADDRAPGRAVSPDDPLYGDRTINGIVRVQREVGGQSRIGVLATSTQLGSGWNRVASVDTRLHLRGNWFFTGQLARSFENRGGNTSHSGLAQFADLTHAGRHFMSSTTYSYLSPEFSAPLAFIKRVNVRDLTQYTEYFWRPESSSVLNFGPSITVSGDWDSTGRLTDRAVNAEFSIDLNGPWGFRVSHYDGYEYYLGTGFHHRRSGASFYASWLRWLAIYGGYGQGTGINYSPANGLSPFLASSQDANFGVTLKPTPRATITESYYFTRLGQPVSSDLADAGRQVTVFNNHIARSKINYQFTRPLSIRAIVDYYSQLPNSSLFQEVKYKQFTVDVLLTYLINPGTAVYAGYTSRYTNLNEPGRPDYLPPILSPSTLLDKVFFVKMSYMFRP